MSDNTTFFDRINYVVSRSIDRSLTLISPYLNTQMRFLRETGHVANLKEPETFSEKLSWLKLYRYAHDPLVKQCADKLKVRDYVTECGFEHLLIPLLDVFRCPKDILWEKLPEQFVLKWNFGCGFNILCSDKKKLNIPKAMRDLKKWEHYPFWLDFAELHYRIPERRIICEAFLDMPPGEELLDYKFYCFHGEPLAVLVIARPADDDKAAVFMSPKWEYLSDIPARYKASLSPECPQCLSEMLSAARKLSAPFPFVRVDFYEQKGKVYFGELTFTPATGVCPSETKLNGKGMGEYIDL